jgi:hypothetical protein
MKTTIKYSALALAVLLVVALAVWGGLLAPARAAGTSYYVDCSAGSNGNGTQASPWNNLTSVNNTTFAAGDQILFKRGATCSGTLYPKGSGASGSPIIIDAYSTGNKPIIAGGGASNAVYLYNQSYWEIRNLEVTNDSASASNRRGVYIKLENYGTGNYYRLTGLTVHNVKGDNTKDGGGSSGIHFDVAGTTTQTKFNDVIVDGCTVYTTDRSGINMSSSWNCRASIGCSSGAAWYPWTNFVVRNNLVYDIGGDGIVIQMNSYALAEYNVVHDINVRSGTYNAGIWAWDADYTTFQYNEAYLARTTLDGQGFDIDYGQVGTVMQYNYSHDNEGGFMLLCTGYTDGNNNGIVRYNISQNDLARVYQVSGPVKNLRIYNNTAYLRSGLSTCVVCEGSWNGNPVDVHFFNNIFYNLGSGGYTLAGSNEFDYNLFYGNHPGSEPSDAHKITSDPLFVNPGSGGAGRTTVDGYKLQAGSPALASGVLIANNGGLDYWGNTVPSNCAPDRGAHQYTSAAGCPTPIPTSTPDPSQNYVQNPGFETGSLSPWGQWNDISVVNNNQRSGSYSLRAGAGPASSEQTVSGLSPNTTYTLIGWGKLASGSGGTVNIGVKSYGGTETSTAVSATSYTQVSINFTTGSSNTSAVIYCYRPSGSGYAYCDDLSVMVAGGGPTATPTNTPVGPTPTPTRTPTPTPTATPMSNYVSNPGFETGSASPWNAWGGSTVVSGNAHSGTYSGKTCTSNCGFEQTISGLSASTTYVLTGWAKLGKTSNSVNIGVKSYGGTETYQTVTSTTYQQKTITFTTGSSNTSAIIFCYKPASSGTSNGYCDDFSVTRQ